MATTSDLDAHLGFWLRLISNQVSAQFKQRVEHHGVSVSDWVALRRLYDDGAASPAALIDSLGMTKGAVSKIVSRLQQRGLVERAGVARDARAQEIRLTAAGKALVPRLAALADHNDAAFFGHLPARERAALMRTLRGLAQFHQLTQVPVD